MVNLTFSSEKTKTKRKTIQNYQYLGNPAGPMDFTNNLISESNGTILKVQDKETKEIYSLKILSKKSLLTFLTKDERKSQMKIYKTIYHPHITRLVTFFEDAETFFLVLEFVEQGSSLYNWLKKKKQVEETIAFLFFLQTCLALDYLHKRQIFHGDLTSKNLLLDDELNIKLCDCVLTNKNYFERKSDYTEPEKATFDPAGPILDIWCLGTLLYEMLHKFVPFKGRNISEKVKDMASKKSVYLSPNLSSEAADLLQKMLVPVSGEIISLDEIFQHPWMNKYLKELKIDLTAMIRQQDDAIKQVDPDFVSTTTNSEHNSPGLFGEKTEEKLEDQPLVEGDTKDNSNDSENVDEEEQQEQEQEEVKNPWANRPIIQEKYEESEEPSWWLKLLNSFGCTSVRTKKIEIRV